MLNNNLGLAIPLPIKIKQELNLNEFNHYSTSTKLMSLKKKEDSTWH